MPSYASIIFLTICPPTTLVSLSALAFAFCSRIALSLAILRSFSACAFAFLSAYDHYYCDDDDNMPEAFVHEAGRFMRRNLKLFPNELPNHPYDDFLRREKNIRIIASSSENAQAHYAASQWLKQYSGSQSAIVLCNESLLLPMLHSLPQDIGTFNITMGYPLTQTPVFSLIQQIVLLHCDAATSSSSHAKFRSKYSLPLLQNSYIRRISEQAKALADELSEQHLFACPAPFFHKDEILTRLFCPVEKVVDLGQLLLDMIRLLADAAADKNNNDNDENDNMMPLYQESLFLPHNSILSHQNFHKILLLFLQNHHLEYHPPML